MAYISTKLFPIKTSLPKKALLTISQCNVLPMSKLSIVTQVFNKSMRALLLGCKGSSSYYELNGPPLLGKIFPFLICLCQLLLARSIEDIFADNIIIKRLNKSSLKPCRLSDLSRACSAGLAGAHPDVREDPAIRATAEPMETEKRVGSKAERGHFPVRALLPGQARRAA